MRFSLIAAALAALGLSGCASMTEDDWNQLNSSMNNLNQTVQQTNTNTARMMGSMPTYQSTSQQNQEPTLIYCRDINGILVACRTIQ